MGEIQTLREMEKARRRLAEGFREDAQKKQLFCEALERGGMKADWLDRELIKSYLHDAVRLADEARAIRWALDQIASK